MKEFIEISTNKGNFTIGLYEGTPIHKSNFISNVTNNIYDSCLFYYTHKMGITKAGLNSDNKDEITLLKNNYPANTLKSEIHPKLIHKTGAVAMYRLDNKNNVNKNSDKHIFYIVEGIKVSDKLLMTLQAKQNAPLISEYIYKYLEKTENKIYKDSLDYYKLKNMNNEWTKLYVKLTDIVKPQISKDGKTLYKLSNYQKGEYLKYGGAPVFDGEYTVFGEIVKGFDLITKINKSKTDLDDKPLENIYILSTHKLNKKEIKALKKQLK